jgi:RHS repeat-associated protein
MGGTLAKANLPQDMTASYDAANHIAQFNSTAYSYDANGNLLTDGQRNYTWDPANRLTQISGSSTASFQYGPYNRRTSKTINGNQTGYLYDGINPVQEQTGSTVTANLLSGGVDELFTRTTASKSDNYLTDALGSTLALTDTTGAVNTQYSYEAYGNTTASGTASDNAYQYTGRENDGTGLYYYRARYYDTQTSRFISQDPIGFGGGVNQFAYVNGNPLSRIDPYGLADIPSPPNNLPGGPYTPAGSGQRPGSFYGPKQPSGPRAQCEYVPDKNTPGGNASADEPYWKTKQPGQKRWSYWDTNGNATTPAEAHPGNPPSEAEPSVRPPVVATTPAVPWWVRIGLGLGLMGYSSPVY